MAPISEKIKFVTPDPYPKAKELKGEDPATPLQTGPRSESSGDVYLPNAASSGRDPQIMDMQRAARESGRTATFGNKGRGEPTGMPKDWRHTVDSNGTSIYRDGFTDESAYRPKVTVRRKRNALPPSSSKAETKKPEAPRKTPVRGWKPEAIPKYQVVPKKTAPPPTKATEHKGNPARPAPNPRQLPKGAGDFTEARANSNAMHQLADRAVDKNGAFSPSALMLRAGAVFYDMSGALPAQKVGEAWGDPNGSVKDRVLSTGELGLAVTQYLPVGKVVGEGIRATQKGSSMLRSSRIGGFAKIPKGGGGAPRTLQTGGHVVKKGTVKALNETFGKKLHKGDWGEALEALKDDLNLAADHHGKILSNGDYCDGSGKVLGNIAEYLP